DPRTPAVATPAAARILPEPPRAAPPVLSVAALRVSQIASHNGERFFLVVDKVNGTVAAFENGGAIFIGSAPTGHNMADVLPADAMSKTYAQQVGVKYKVTPAGRFTLSPGYDPKYGDLLDINELQGADWAIAIHRVSLGNPAQQRAARLRSSDGQD